MYLQQSLIHLCTKKSNNSILVPVFNVDAKKDKRLKI